MCDILYPVPMPTTYLAGVFPVCTCMGFAAARCVFPNLVSVDRTTVVCT